MELRLHFIDGSIIEKKDKLLELEYFKSNERFNKDKTEFNFTPEEFSCVDFICVIDSLSERRRLHDIENDDIINYFGVPVNIIKLLEHQFEHVEFIENLLKINNFYLDCSSMGCGKTFISLYLAQKYKFKLIVVCPKSMISSWKQLSEDYNIELLFITTYQSFRGCNKRVKHDYLTVDFDGNYFPTDTLIEMATNKILVIYDEIQYVKNTSQQLNACVALSKCILRNNNSRLGCLSATPFDKEELCVNLMYLTQIIKADKLYTYDNRERTYNYTGYNELIDLCKLLDRSTTVRIALGNIEYNVKKVMLKRCYKLFIQVLQPIFISSMKHFVIPFENDCANFYGNLDEEQDQKIKRLIQKLRCALRMLFNDRANRADIMANITYFMKAIELIKTESIVKRLVDNDLAENDNKKILIYVNYYQSINKLKEFYPNALQLSGNMSIKERDITIGKFQQHNMNHNILISNIRVGGIGVNLHDINGNFPRKMYILPSYSILDIHQATGRIYRAGTMSDSTVRIVYSKNNEKRLLEILAKKGTVLKSITEDINICSNYKNINEPLIV